LKDNNQPLVDSASKPVQARGQHHDMTAWLNGGSIAGALALELVLMSQEEKMFGKETINHWQHCQLANSASQLTICMAP